MEIKHLKLVKCIVEEGTIAAAARQLHLTSGALSQQLKELESQVGTKLFDRVRQRLTLTEAGGKVYEAARDVLARLERAHGDIRKLINQDEGTINVATECYTCYQWLPAVVEKFRHDFKTIAVNIVFEATHQPLRKLLTGEIDLAIVHTQLDDPAIRYHPLFKDELVAIISKRNPLSRRAFLAPADFERIHLITHTSALEDTSIYRRVLGPEKIRPREITVLPVTEASIALVEANLGVMVMPRWAIQHYLDHRPDITTIRVTRKGLFRSQCMVVRADPHPPQYLHQFGQFMMDEIKARYPVLPRASEKNAD